MLLFRTQDLEGVQADDLKVKAKVGYRADRILRLAKSFRDGSVDPAWLEAPERTRYRNLSQWDRSVHTKSHARSDGGMCMSLRRAVALLGVSYLDL